MKRQIAQLVADHNRRCCAKTLKLLELHSIIKIFVKIERFGFNIQAFKSVRRTVRVARRERTSDASRSYSLG